MPAEQALKAARRRVGHGGGRDGSSQAWRARLEESAAAATPAFLIGGLALAGGGFDLTDRHIAGLLAWLLVVALLVLGVGGRATTARPFHWAAGLTAALALLCAFSSLWSGSVELSVIEADRVLVYLGFFLVAFLLAQTARARQRFGEGLAIALIGVAALALASRLLPDLVSVAESGETGARLSWPLGYWNGDGVLFGIAAGTALWLSRRALGEPLRVLAAASLPVVLLALYFTYSRGGLLALALACGVLVALSRDRLWLFSTLAIGGLAAVPALLAVQARESLARDLDDAHVAGQGATVLLILLAGCLLAALLFVALRRLERRGGRLTGRALAASRDPRLLRAAALTAALVAVAGLLAVGGRAWDEFSRPDVRALGTPDAFTTLSGSGRDEFWRVGLEAFGEEPLLGQGAGTYRFSWHLLRDNEADNLDAHSLYLQAFAELGVVGGLLVLALVGTLLWTGFAAWRAARGASRDLHAALLGAALAFAVCAAIDWFWLIATLGAVFFLASGVLVAARCAQLARAGAAAAPRRYGAGVLALVGAWVAALALVGPLLAQREIDASNSAAAEGNLVSAVNHAENARAIEPWATSPYRQLGLLAEREGDYPAAIEWLDEAIDREGRSWLLYYIRARIHHRAGDDRAADADLAEAQRLNPNERCLYEGYEGCG